ncbi:MAG: glycosyltransferase [Clostridiaceae bacterium]
MRKKHAVQKLIDSKDQNNHIFIRASIAMAVYNGERFIAEQINSILPMLSLEDEIIISYDDSQDQTWNIISEYADTDNRIRIFRNEYSRGVEGNFTNAVMRCNGQYILLCDQDDVWIDGKIQRVVDHFELTGADLIIHDGYDVNMNLEIQGDSLFEKGHISTSPFRNYIRGTCWGCCMAFRADIRKELCPFPSRVAHDLWTVILCGAKRAALLPRKLTLHRLHGSNVTPLHRQALPVILSDRARLLFYLVKRRFGLMLRRV